MSEYTDKRIIEALEKEAHTSKLIADALELIGHQMKSLAILEAENKSKNKRLKDLLNIISPDVKISLKEMYGGKACVLYRGERGEFGNKRMESQQVDFIRAAGEYIEIYLT